MLVTGAFSRTHTLSAPAEPVPVDLHRDTDLSGLPKLDAVRNSTVAGQAGELQPPSQCESAAAACEAVTSSVNTDAKVVTGAHFDFVEIGTSDFDTLLHTARDGMRGLSVEPLCHYLDALPNRTGMAKVCAAVTGDAADGAGGTAPATADVYFVHPDDIARHGLNNYLRGCSSLGAPHPTAGRELAARGLSHLQRSLTVPVVSVSQLFTRHGIASLDAFKVDTEGHDAAILAGLMSYCDGQPSPAARASCWPRRIQFESNILTPRAVLVETVAGLARRGYALVTATEDDTLLEYRPLY